MITIAPASERSRNGIAASTAATVPMMSTEKPLRHAASSAPTASALTFGTTMSRPPSSSAASAIQPRRAAESATSRARPVAATPLARSAATLAATSSALRAHRATEAPSSARRSAMEPPIPLVPPVTRARHPLRPRSMTSSSSVCRQAWAIDFAIEAPSVYFGSTMLPRRTRPHCVSSM